MFNPKVKILCARVPSSGSLNFQSFAHIAAFLTFNESLRLEIGVFFRNLTGTL